MSVIKPGDITRELREWHHLMEQTDLSEYGDSKRENRFLDLINAVERLEGNFLYLANITAATADDLSEIKTISAARLHRHYGILETVERMLNDISPWHHPSRRDHVADRVTRVLVNLSTRLKVPRL